MTKRKIIVTSSFKRDIKRRYLDLVTAEWAEVLDCLVANRPLPEKYLTETQYGFFDAIPQALRRTAEVSALTLDVVGKLITGTISVDNLSGPIAIAKGAGDSAGYGLVYFLGFLGLISVNLGIMNLLPLPVLDGGHLLYHVAEVIKRSPLSERVMELGQQIGMAILLVLMAFAFFNDINRLFSG